MTAVSPIRVCIAGAGGRMGQALLEGVRADARFALASALDVAGSPALGREVGLAAGRDDGVPITSDIDAGVAAAGVLIDFTRPAGTLVHLDACARRGIAAVVGTTGLDDADKRALHDYGKRIPIVFAANMSVGVNVLLSLVEDAARALGSGFDIEIVEMHHKHKVDAPSGTALRLGEAAAAGLGRKLEDILVPARHGITGERKDGTIGFAALRGGDVVGEHTVLFASEGERIEITHRATSRKLFVAGALRAAAFVAEKRARGETGVFDMPDVLGLR